MVSTQFNSTRLAFALAHKQLTHTITMILPRFVQNHSRIEQAAEIAKEATYEAFQGRKTFFFVLSAASMFYMARHYNHLQ